MQDITSHVDKVKSAETVNAPSAATHIMNNGATYTTIAAPVDEQFEVGVLENIKKEKIGKVIGKGGHVIKKLTSENTVKMSIGKWSEKVPGKVEEYADKFEGVLIQGRHDRVLKTSKAVRDILNADPKKE